MEKAAASSDGRNASQLWMTSAMGPEAEVTTASALRPSPSPLRPLASGLRAVISDLRPVPSALPPVPSDMRLPAAAARRGTTLDERTRRIFGTPRLRHMEAKPRQFRACAGAGGLFRALTVLPP